MLRIPIIALLASVFLQAGDTRNWTNPEGTKTFEAEFTSREGDEITLKRADGSVIAFDISKLHEDDRRWLNLNHPVGADGAPQEVPDNDAIFDDLKFGDSRELVIEKLKTSTVVEAELEETFFGRTGLNGTYRTRQKVGGLYCYLFYDFDNAGSLRELTMRTVPQPESEYGSSVSSCWEELPNLISMLHGKPFLAGDIPSASKIEEGAMLGSHAWRIEGGGNVLLGIAKVEGKYEVSVRFTLEKLDLRPTP
ncbi:MAG: hypothetical protein NWT08_07370 [Akkermansiaceae bacterium]|jgi:hypothetical protein|nr:hypothetical protein [Akkermansiaceae bacterium]MDP4645852.1 hypothetical protein [Akkermansiaceae bacterium]MDP4720434.1 hypothetical protein [Akkermansiaceae bacterium]MDP4779172.1 hypothetical protein [Akkermansiaceae bacterium]MDP4848215.1 hypothetical protein [Akkermansiaceae bacterium]